MHYSEVNNDDTIATWAQELGGSVLSRDRDFLKYKEATFPIFKDFEIDEDGEVILLSIDSSYERLGSKQLLKPRPPTKSYYAYIEEILKPPCSIMRGSVSALTRDIGSSHLLIADIRQALYEFIGVKPENCL